MKKKYMEKIYSIIKEIENEGYFPFPFYYQKKFKKIFNYDDYTLLLKEEDLLNLETLICEPMELKNELSEYINILKKEIKEIVKNIGYLKENINELKQIKDKVNDNSVKKLFEKSIITLNQNLEKMQNKLEFIVNKINNLENQILFDHLTKAFNRKKFENDINQILNCNNDDDKYMLIIDIDDFKKINDTYGHIVGDIVLKKIVNLIKEIFKENGKIYRYGGDEFILIIKNNNIKELKKKLDILYSKLKNTYFKYKNKKFKIGLSIGGTKIDRIYKRKERLFEICDKNLYKVKENGKNKYIIE